MQAADCFAAATMASKPRAPRMPNFLSATRLAYLSLLVSLSELVGTYNPGFRLNGTSIGLCHAHVPVSTIIAYTHAVMPGL